MSNQPNQSPMKSFHGNQELKDMLVEEVHKHQKADEIIQGTYETDGKYCAVGCAIQSLNARLGKTYSHSDHGALETEFGVPRILWRLEDRIFEGLTKEEARLFPLKFAESIPVGADLSLVWPQFAVWILTDKKYGVIQYAKTEERKEIIKKVANLYTQVINGTPIESLNKEFKAAAADAASAAYAADSAYAAASAADAAASAAYAADAAAYSAADAAAASAAYAAYAAAYAASAAYAAYAAASAARTTFYATCAKKLIELITACH